MTAHPQRGAALVLLAVSAAYSALALRLEDAVSAPVFVLGPRSFPLFVGAAGILTSIVILLLEPSSPARAASSIPAPRLGAESASAGVFAGDWRRTLALCAFMLLYAVALPRAGFTLSTAAFLAASFRLLGERRAVALALVPVAVAVVVLGLLRGALGAHLPEPWLDAVLLALR